MADCASGRRYKHFRLRSVEVEGQMLISMSHPPRSLTVVICIVNF